MRSIKNANMPVKLAGVLIFLALALYVGLNFIRSSENPYETAQAIQITVRESCTAKGIIVRDEELLRSVYNTVHITAGEGTRVSGGQVIAEAFDTEEGLKNAVAVAELEERIESLREQQYRRYTKMDMMSLDKDIWNACKLLRAAALKRDFVALQEDSLSLQTLSFAAFNDDEDLERQLKEDQSRLDALKSNAGRLSAKITATDSGLFSTEIDGLEWLKPEDLKSLTVADVNSLLNAKDADTALALGKLVYGSRWYYAALLDEKDAGRLRSGRTVTIYLGRYYNRQLTVRIEWVSNPDSGQQAVLFSCGTNMTDILGMRRQDAELIFSEKTGFRVPRSAIHVAEDGTPCVYVKIGLRAERKRVEVLYDYDEYYVVGSTELRAGDAVITSGRQLSDGRVIDG